MGAYLNLLLSIFLRSPWLPANIDLTSPFFRFGLRVVEVFSHMESRRTVYVGEETAGKVRRHRVAGRHTA